MLKHRASEGPAELQRGSTFIQETPGVRQSYSCVSLQRHRLFDVLCTSSGFRLLRDEEAALHLVPGGAASRDCSNGATARKRQGRAERRGEADPCRRAPLRYPKTGRAAQPGIRRLDSRWWVPEQAFFIYAPPAHGPQ